MDTKDLFMEDVAHPKDRFETDSKSLRYHSSSHNFAGTSPQEIPSLSPVANSKSRLNTNEITL